MSSPNRSLPLYRIWLTVFFGYLSLGGTLQTLPLFMTQCFQATPLMVGLTISLAYLSAALTRPLAGRLADKGLAKPIVMLGCLLGILGGLGQWMSPNLTCLLIARFFMGIGEGALFNAAIAFVLHHYVTEKRGTIGGWFGLSMWGGLCGGPALSAWLYAWTANINIVWIFIIILPLIGLILISFTPIIPYLHSQHSSATKTLLPKGAKLPGLGFLLMTYGYGSINTLLILYLINCHLPGQGIVLSLFAACFLITRALGSPLVTRFGGRFILLTSIGIEIIGLLLIAIPLIDVILMGTALTGIGVALLYPAFISIIIQRVSVAQHGVAVGLLTSCGDMGLLTAGITGGLIVSLAGFSWAFLTAAGLAFIAFLLVIFNFSQKEYLKN